MTNHIDIRITQDRETAMDAAMCVWEWALETMQNEQVPALDDEKRTNGMGSVRLALGQLAETVEAAWQIAHHLGYDDSFDWEFVPEFMHWIVCEEKTLAPTRAQCISATIYAMGEEKTVADIEKAIQEMIEERA